MLLICSNCKRVLPVTEKCMPIEEGHSTQGDIQCSRCHTIYRVTVNMLYKGDKYHWNPVEGELKKNGLTKGQAGGTGTGTRQESNHGN